MSVISLSEYGVKNQMFILLFIGMIASFIGTLVGGGGLITIPGMILTGIPIQNSIASNKFSSGLSALSSVYYLIYRKQIKIKAISKSFLITFIGGIGGALLTSQVHEKTMNIVAIILLLIAFLVTINNQKWIKKVDINSKTAPFKPLQHVLLFLIAVYDGGFGPGSSVMGILFYMKKSGAYVKAVQLTRILILGSCAGSFIIYYKTGFIEWTYAVPMAIGSILGSHLGIVALPLFPLKLANSLIITIICLLMIQMIIRLI